MTTQVRLYEGRISGETSRRLETIHEVGKLHSRFQHTLNIVLNIQLPNLITLGDERLLGSPNSVAITDFQQLLHSISEHASFLVVGDRIYIDTYVIIQLKIITEYEQEPLLETPDLSGSITRQRQFLEQELIRLNPYPEQPAYLPFFQQVILEGEALVAAITTRNWLDTQYHGRRLLGLGVGLTPSGDDYLTGLLLSLDNIESHTNNHAAFILKQHVSRAIFGGNKQHLDRTNDISQHQLYFAQRGEGKVCVLNLIKGIKQKRFTESELQVAIKEVLSIGSTSGYDLLLGVLAGLTMLTRSEEQSK